jgi:hypothetical protein
VFMCADCGRATPTAVAAAAFILRLRVCGSWSGGGGGIRFVSSCARIVVTPLAESAVAVNVCADRRSYDGRSSH